MAQPKREKCAAQLLGHTFAPQSTHERILFQAMNLFYDHGFHAVGLDRIIAEAGVTKTTFYNHFSSRDDLVLEVIQRRDAMELAAWVGEIERRAGRFNPRGLILSYFDVLHDWFNAPDFRGCMFINAAHEFPLATDPVHQAARLHKQKTLEKMREFATAAGARDPQLLAQQIMVLGEGAITLRVAMGNDDAALVARAAAERLMAGQLPEASSSGGAAFSAATGSRH